MNRQELVQHIADRAGINKKQAQAALDAIFSPRDGAISIALRSGNRFAVTGFGSFTAPQRGARTGRNPRTGATVEIAAGRRARFTAGKTLREALNG